MNKSGASRSRSSAGSRPHTSLVSRASSAWHQSSSFAHPACSLAPSFREAPAPPSSAWSACKAVAFSFSQSHKGASRRRAAPGSQSVERRHQAAHGLQLRQSTTLSLGQHLQAPAPLQSRSSSARLSRPGHFSLHCSSGTNRAMPCQPTQEPPSNLTLNRTANGMAPWPRGALVHHAPRGQGAMPSSAG